MYKWLSKIVRYFDLRQPRVEAQMESPVAATPSWDPATAAALEGSIRKWKNIVAGTETDRGPLNCPLCHKFHKTSGPISACCAGCPVRIATGYPFCEQSPYTDYVRAAHRGQPNTLELAQKELDFLKGLRR
jgi:hypothetical protein